VTPRRRNVSAVAIGLTVLLAAVLLTIGTSRDDSKSPTSSPQGSSSAAQLPGGAEAPEPPGYIWTDPFGPKAVEISSADDAQTAFEPDVPDKLPDPTKAETADPSQVSMANRGIAWTYKDSAGSPYIVVEEIFNATQEELELPATHKSGCSTPDESGSYDCAGSFSIKEIRGGVRALLSQGPEVTTVEWFEPLNVKQSEEARAAIADLSHPVLDVRVMGPTDSFTPEDAVDVANGI